MSPVIQSQYNRPHEDLVFQIPDAVYDWPGFILVRLHLLRI